LQLAPKTECPELIFGSTRSKGQSILVTHYVDSQMLIRRYKSRDSGDDNDDLDDIFEPHKHIGDTGGITTTTETEDTEDDTLPWPVGHDSFLNSPLAQQNLCFEIASGPLSKSAPEWISGCAPFDRDRDENNNIDRATTGPVLLPGSLRERGDFCIVRLSLIEQTLKNISVRKYAWEVQNVDFHTVNNFG
jgi:hypothetical protein